MDTNVYNALAELAEDILEYHNLVSELRAIARFINEPKHKKRLESVARFLESEVPYKMFAGSRATAYAIIRVLSSAELLSDEEVGAKIGKSASTVKQTVGALRAGGLQFEETHTKGYRLRDKRGYGKKRAVARENE